MKKNLSLLGLVLVLLVFNKSELAQFNSEAESKQTTYVKLEVNGSGLRSVFENRFAVHLFDEKNAGIYFDEHNPEVIDPTPITLTEKCTEELPISLKQSNNLNAEKAAESTCFKWHGWQTTSTYCGYNYFCFGKNQRATYRDEKRTCKTNSNHTQTRTVKIKCGC